ncbi:ATP-binding cassette domain-containing protein [Brachybacterium hainanense]|uniref:ATP-binding cassette domain-containing protein n=1 Tax=Brachybacterium hainanense TaxID=1541174 RepID=A0ABV6RE16_9MICO
MTTTAAADLRLAGLSWRPATRREPTLEDVTLHVPAGQRVLLTGASGSGKSTLLLALAGLLDPETGDLSGTAEGPGRPGARALLLQHSIHALVGASVGRDTAFGPENAALDRAVIARTAAAALDAAQVDVPASASPFTLSGGQQQRVALAGSLATAPEVLLLDEPLAMLDAATADAATSALLAAARGRTLVIADHDTARWLPHVDRVVLLGPQARILADGPPGAVVLPRAEPPGPAPVTTVDGVEVAALEDVAIRRRGKDGPILHEHLSLALRAGTLGVLTGPSGTGKTTLLRVLLGLEAPAAGTVRRPGAVAFVPQEPEHSFIASTVRAEASSETLLARAGLEHLADANPFTLSGGEQRRLSIVAALARRPTLLVLDEPTVGLDDTHHAAVLDLLEEAAARGCAVIAATHDPRLVARAGAHLALGPVSAETSTSPSRAIGPVPRPGRRTPADACNPLVLSAIGLLAAIGSFGISSWQIGLAALLPVLLLSPLAVRSLRGAAVRLAPVLLSAAALAWTTALLSPLAPLSGPAWLLGAKEALRITVFVSPGVLALASVDVTALGDALRLHLRAPGRPVAAGVAALVRIGHLGQQWDRILTARELRGLGTRRDPRLLASATLALLVDTLRSAQQQALAMDARGFASAEHRTIAVPSPVGRADAIGLAIGLALLAWPWALHLLLG